MAILNAILNPLSIILNNLYSFVQKLFTQMEKELEQQPKHPPGPSPNDEDEKEIFHKTKNLLEYFSFGAPRLMQKYGGIIRLGNKQYFIADKEAFKYILKTNVNNFSKRNMTYDRIRLIFGQGLIVNEGPKWEQHRQLLHPVFNRQRLQNYSNIMTQYTTELIEKWQKTIALDGSAIPIAKEMGQLTLRIAFSVFSHHNATHKEIETIIQLFERGNPHISYFPFIKPWVPTPRNLLFFHSIKKLDKLLEAIIEARKKSISNTNAVTTALEKFTVLDDRHYTDALEILLTAKEKHNLTLTPSQIIDEYKTLLITGHETTGCGLTWACYLLAKHPKYRELMEAELDDVLKGRLPTMEDCLDLPVTKAVFLETLRLYPSIWILPRVSIEQDNICGYDFPAKSHFLINLYALHRNPEYWEEPETFYPPRFMGDAESRRDPFSYLPFSIGPHSCIGSNFGVMEGILVLATLWQRLRFEVVGKKDYKPEPYVSLRPPANLKMRVIIK